MGKPRLFSTAAVSAMRDTELTGLDWRVYLWVSLHDGMSLLKGKGMGCIASNKTLFAEVGCDYTAGCRSLSKLEKAGHLVREKLGRATRYRVAFPDPDNLQAGNISDRAKACRPASDEGAIACRDNFEARRNLPKTASDYILQSSIKNSSEEGIKDSTKVAHLSGAHPSDDDVLDSIFASGRFSSERSPKRKDPAEAGCGEWALKPHLPSNLSKLPLGAQVSRIEAAFNAIGRDADRMASDERSMFAELLYNIGDEYSGGELDAVAQQANRLWEEMAVY